MLDLPNGTWAEYGMRVGFWRLYDCLRDFKIVPTLARNGSLATDYPGVATAALEAGWEFMFDGVRDSGVRFPSSPAAIDRR